MMDGNAVRRAATAAAKAESRREREFYKYYDPIRLLTDQDPPFYDNVASPDLALRGPIPGPDKVLTSFCQLAALRLRASRAILFFFNVQSAYVLAESTQTSSLHDAASAKSHLWLGFAALPRTQTICYHTLRPSPAPPGIPPVTTIGDLHDHDNLRTLACVTGFPHARFYTGLPIVTARGIDIGAFCVLDVNPRAGITPDEETFLREMSVIVMSHLEALRGSSAHQRDVRMIAGLDQFVEGSSTQRTEREKQSRPGSGNAARKSSRKKESSSLRSQSSIESRMRTADTRRRKDSPAKPAAAPGPNTSSPLPFEARPSTPIENSHNPPEASPPQPTSTPNPKDAKEGKLPEELYDNIVPLNVRSTFQRAAKLLCDAIEVDQITFLDASVGSFGGLVNSSEDASGSSIGSRAAGATVSDDPISFPHHAKDSSKMCRVLGEAISPAAGTEGNKGSPDVSERFLASLLRRYPRGRSFTLDDLETTSSDDAARTTQIIDFGRNPTNRGVNSSGEEATSPARRYRKQGKHRDLEQLKRLYPDAHSLAICPLWDHTRGRWFAACVLWTSSPSRVFAAELELGFVDAFCDVVMAEVHRVEVERSEKAKTDFISSISHELRSPLHGILGSAEMLKEQTLDEFSESMVEQISSCGSNLLDIIDNLLDYSDINFNSKNRRTVRRTESQDEQSSDGSALPKTTLMSSSNDVAIDQITEEAVDASVSSHYFSRKPDSSQKVVTILDIEKVPTKCKIAVGGWKRVCVNLVTNALKYTSTGQIYISLKTLPFGPPNSKRFEAILSVADSGKGMSQDFARNGLLQAFKQEDTMTEGTGLGMHLVARIVKAFGGHIEVRTDQTGGGTCITITVPLDASPPAHQLEDVMTRVPSGLPEQAGPLMVGLLRWKVSETTSPVSLERAQTRQLDALKNTCHREGFETIDIDQHTIDNHPTQVNIITEMDLPHLFDHDQEDRLILDAIAESKPLIVICESAKSQLELKKALESTVPDKVIGYLLQPAGPKRLRKAIQSVLMSGEPPNNNSGTMLNLSSRTSSPANGAVPHTTQDTSGFRNNIVPNMYRSSTPNPQRNVPSPQQHLSRTPPSSPKPPSDRNITLMVVEDNRVNQRLLVMYARRRNYEVIIANNGKEALELYTRAHKPTLNNSTAPPSPGGPKPDAILMDINMPVMDGFASMRAIRAFERRQGLPSATIFALTGLGSADAQREAFTSGCDHFLTKPVHFAELAKLLERDGLDAGA